MLAAISFAAASFAPNAAPNALARPAVHSAAAPVMAVDDAASRRQLIARAGAALAGAAFASSASAKAGQFGKIGIFTMDDISSPYQPGGPKSGKDATFGYQKSEGAFLAEGYEADVTREKKDFLESVRRIKSLGPKVESQTWWFVRDELRIQAYNMRSSMLALNKVNANKAACEAAYKKYWKEVEMFDLALTKKELALATKEYSDVLTALDEYTKLV
ncbi:hypothetical protein AB1Y20_013387 [Prymnesium parvum]|uniref:Uncharacterized protein n=1 Tax=Prymnesium parvum TaxID=97485 RepID=A0AB34IGJ4_PRYPA|mmetsp:Transcript_41950/g.96128  ORF Transcript_41950/g.96128 Transcript_41950/m.96128 type:complete len:217 (-) Transcript_41950:251-901(-)